MTRGWTEEEIASFVDGALEPDETERVAAILDQDPEAKAVADEIRKSNALLQAAYEDVASAPVPPALAAALAAKTEKVVPLRRRVPKSNTWLPLAAAASIAIVVGFTAGTQIYVGDPPPQVTLGDVPQESDLHAALETLPSGTRQADRIAPMLTFTDAAGRYCREFEVTGDLPDELEFGIACRTQDATWHVEIIVSAPITEPNGAGFAPASGPGADALAAMIDALGGGEPLAPNVEAAKIENGWKP